MDKLALDVLHHLLADLFDSDKSRLDLMGSDIVTSDLIPKDLKFELAVMEGFERCDQKGEAPTPENVALLSMSKNPKMLEMCRELASKANARPMVKANAIWWRGWAQQELLTEASEKISRLAKMDYGDAQAKQSMMMDELINVNIHESQDAFTRIEIIDRLEDVQKARVARFAQGQALGGVLHLESLREAVPVLAEGDLTLLTAQAKGGKSTSAMILAEQNAIENDCDVLWLLFETSANTIEERFLARELLIPGKALRSGIVDLTKDPFKKPYDYYKERQREYWDKYGHIHLQYVAGAKLSEIAAQIRIHKRLADTRNRPLLVMVDYLQRIPKMGSKTEVEALALISNFLKDLAVRYDCHIILFSQESFSADGKAGGDSRAHGSNTPIFVSQVHIAMRVLNANQKLTVGDETGVWNDALGNERLWQVPGTNKRQCVVRYDIIRANDNDTGSAYCAYENGLFLMVDLSGKDAKIPPVMAAMIKSFDMDLKDPTRRLI